MEPEPSSRNDDRGKNDGGQKCPFDHEQPSALRGRRRGTGGEVLLEEDLGCDVIHRLAGWAAGRASPPPRFVRGKELALQLNLDADSFKSFSEAFCASRGGSAGAVLEGWQTEDDSCRTDLRGEGGNLLRSAFHTLIGHDLER